MKQYQNKALISSFCSLSTTSSCGTHTISRSFDKFFARRSLLKNIEDLGVDSLVVEQYIRGVEVKAGHIRLILDQVVHAGQLGVRQANTIT